MRNNVTISPKTDANTKDFTARAANSRPYKIIGRQYDKLKFELLHHRIGLEIWILYNPKSRNACRGIPADKLKFEII